MKLLQKKRNRFILFLIVWWMGIAIFYMMTSIKMSQVRKTIRQSGVEMAKVFSRRASLPLLELDMPTLSALLRDYTSSSDIVYAAIVDHKNNVIAYTSVEMILSIKKEGASTVDHVSFWERDSSDYKRIVNFSSDVTYAETKIGEIYLALSAAKIDQFKKRFCSFALSNVTIVLLVVIALYYKKMSAIVIKMKAAYQSQVGRRDIFAETSCIACPLCGTNKPFSQDVFNGTKLNQFRMIRSTHRKLKSEAFQSKEISLSEIAKRKDLAWLKRQVIVRCLEIIKKLAA